MFGGDRQKNARVKVTYLTSNIQKWLNWWAFLKILALGIRGGTKFKILPGGRYSSYANAYTAQHLPSRSRKRPPLTPLKPPRQRRKSVRLDVDLSTAAGYGDCRHSLGACTLRF